MAMLLLPLLLVVTSSVHLLRKLSINTLLAERFPLCSVCFIHQQDFQPFLILLEHVWISLRHRLRVLLPHGHSKAVLRHRNPLSTELRPWDWEWAVRQSSHSVCAYKWNHLHPKYHLYCYGFSLFPPEHWQDALGVFFSLRYQNKISSKRLASEFWCQGVGASPWVIQLKAKLRGGGFHFRN